MSKKMEGKVRSGLVSAMALAMAVAFMTAAMAMAMVMVFPALSRAGSLEPSGPPGPTMKTLDEIYEAAKESPSWSRRLPDNERFELIWPDGPVNLLTGEKACVAVLDKETGLVWERSPSTTTMTWVGAVIYAYELSLGGRNGWRLPTVEELESLVDPTQSNPSLPSGHPFQNVQSSHFWSSTTFAGDPDAAWDVRFLDGGVGAGGKSGSSRVWCVRGGAGHDAY
jgi:hypothetical protein